MPIRPNGEVVFRHITEAYLGAVQGLARRADAQIAVRLREQGTHDAPIEILLEEPIPKQQKILEEVVKIYFEAGWSSTIVDKKTFWLLILTPMR